MTGMLRTRGARRGARFDAAGSRPGVREGSMNGKFVGYVARDDPLRGFLGMIARDRLEVTGPRLAFRAFRLCGSNEVYAYEEKFSGAKVICKFYGTRFATDPGKAAWMARQEYEGLETTWWGRRTT
jgi:hypothetical protein